MQRYSGVVQDKTGRAISGAQVLVKKNDDTPATIYSNNGSTVAANPLTTDAFGKYSFYGPDGRYNLYAYLNGKLVGQDLDQLLEDPADGSAINIDGGTISNSALNSITIDGVAVDGADIAKYSTLATSAASSLLGYIAAGVGAVASTIQSRLRLLVSADDYSSIANAITAAGNRELYFPSGTWNITSNTTFTCPVRLADDAVFAVSTGVTLTFSRQFRCGLHQAFSLTGTAAVAFNQAANRVGYPEWWGAVTGGPDCKSAIEKCFEALPITQLQGADYWLASMPVFNTPHRKLRGAGSLYQLSGQGVTRLIISSTTLDGMQVGPSVQPGTINDFTAGMEFEDFQLARSAAPTISSGCRGILNQFTLYAKFKRVRSVESMFGWEFKGTAVTHCDDCYGTRSTVGQGAGTDYFRGMYFNGNTSIGASGGNASLYINRPNVSVGGITIADSIGYYADANFSDVFLTSPEASGMSTPLQAVGNNSAASNYGNINFRIVNPVFDAFDLNGIHLKNIGKYGVVQVVGGYTAASADGTVVAGVRVESCSGAIDISGLQVIGGVNANCGGIYATNSSNIRTRGNAYLECARGPIYLDTVTDSVFSDTAKMNNLTAAAGVTLLQNCTRVKVDCIMTGAANKLGLGVNLAGATNTYNEINASNIDAACITGGEANKVTINSVQITATGLSGTNLVTGLNNTSLNFSWPTVSFTTATITTVNGTTVNGSTALTAGGLGSAGYLSNLRSNSSRFAALMQYCAADGNAPIARFAKNRGTVASPTALSSSDNAMEITVTTWDGTADRNMASIFVAAPAAHASGDTPGEIQFWTTPAGSTTRAKRLTVDKDGALVHASGTTKVVDASGHLGLRSYTVGTLPSAATAAFNIYVSNETGGATPAFSDGTNWRRYADRAIVS